MKKAIMFCGTASGVGKSIITAGFCRVLANRGLKVAPFKAQNMSLNSTVTPFSEEISIAQSLQAFACRITPTAHMNPILIKPEKGKSYIVRMGKPYKTLIYKDYYKLFSDNFKIAKKAFDKLKEDFDYIIIEGAGSPAEINLQQYDFANMLMANHANADVYIIGDIDRGGVFAHFKGTYDLIQSEYKKLIKGFIINKFRGDLEILKPAFDIFKQYIDLPIIGVLPLLKIELDEEDSLFTPKKNHGSIRVCVISLPHMSNFTDFLIFNLLNDVSISFVKKPNELFNCDIVILPGSKATTFDIEYIAKSGFYRVLKEIFGKKPIIGICGGYQMLGEKVKNKKALGFLGIETDFSEEKILKTGEYDGEDIFTGIKLKGYEIHHGISKVKCKLRQLLKKKDACIFDEKNLIIGTYLHGIFNNKPFLEFVFSLIGKNIDIDVDIIKNKDEQLNKLAEAIEENIPVESMLK